MPERGAVDRGEQALLAARANLLTAYIECEANGDSEASEHIADSVAELDTIDRDRSIAEALSALVDLDRTEGAAPESKEENGDDGAAGALVPVA